MGHVLLLSVLIQMIVMVHLSPTSERPFRPNESEPLIKNNNPEMQKAVNSIISRAIDPVEFRPNESEPLMKNKNPEMQNAVNSITSRTIDPVKLRLVGGSQNHEGRVELFIHGRWGTICDDSWDDRDAQVICRMLGYGSGMAHREAAFGAGQGQIFLDDVNCMGHEDNIFACKVPELTEHNCNHNEDAGVTCTNDMYIRLRGGNRNSGRVEILKGNIWGTVCDDHWNASSAQVVCRQLGYSYGYAKNRAYYGEGSGKIWLDNVQCNGSERWIGDCRRNNWGVHDCGHDEDAGVSCTNDLPVRLIGINGENEGYGTVQVFYYGLWGTICDDGWSDEDASVICRMMGYSFGKARAEAYYREGTGKIWLDSVNCVGNETSIFQCKKDSWGVHDCGHHEDAGVDCY